MNRCVYLLAICLFLATNVRAQDELTLPQPKVFLEGVVYDANGAVIVGAVVNAYDLEDHRFQTTTNSDGTYRIQLTPRVYRVEAKAEWFCPSSIERFRVVESTLGRMNLDFVLEVGTTVHTLDLKSRDYSAHLSCDTPDKGKKPEEGKKGSSKH